jgi:two-component system, response regulator PdtaR
VADKPTRQVVLIVEDEALVRMTALDMIEEAGFAILEATNADKAMLLLEAGSTSPWYSPISKCPVR